MDRIRRKSTTQPREMSPPPIPPLNEALEVRSEPIQVGDIAPDFSLLDQQSQLWHLNDAVEAGGVVLCFFPMAFTPVCESEMKCITAELGQWKSKNVRMVGISCDTPPALEAWAKVLGLDHTLLSDIHRSVSKAYGLHWPEMNLSHRGTIIIGAGRKVCFTQVRPFEQAMEINKVLKRPLR